jgi:hypothetical protein
MRYINNIEFILMNLVDKDLKQAIDNLKKSYASGFIEGGVGKKGGLPNNFGARYILNNNPEGLIVFHKLVELSKGLYEAYARIYVTDADIPKVRFCNGKENHKTIYTLDKTCSECGRLTKDVTRLTKECKAQLNDKKVSLDDL